MYPIYHGKIYIILLILIQVGNASQNVEIYCYVNDKSGDKQLSLEIDNDYYEYHIEGYQKGIDGKG